MEDHASTDEPDSRDDALHDSACRGQIAGTTELQSYVSQKGGAERHEGVRAQASRFQQYLSIESDGAAQDRREHQPQRKRSRVWRNTNCFHVTRLRLAVSSPGSLLPDERAGPSNLQGFGDASRFYRDFHDAVPLR